MRKILTPEEVAAVRHSLSCGPPGDQAAEWGREILGRVIAVGSPMVRHPLGFVCIPVERGEPVGVCLHLWLPALANPPLATSPVHAHSWKLSSHVLCGSLVHDRIQVQQAVRDPTHRIFSVQSAGLVDRVEPTGRLVTQRLATSQSIPAGTTYELPAGEFHSTEVRGMTATLVLAEAGNAGPEYALAGIDQGAYSRPRQLCGPGEVAAVQGAFGGLNFPGSTPWSWLPGPDSLTLRGGAV